MKKVLVYILLITIVLENSSLTQLFKIANLFEHYFDHQNRNQDITFVNFLSMHYWGNDIPDHDDDEDNKLPFKKEFVSFHFYYLSGSQQILTMPPIVWNQPLYSLPNNYNLPIAYLNPLFKPPQENTISNLG